MKRSFNYGSLSVAIAMVLALVVSPVNADGPTPDRDVVPFGLSDVSYLNTAAAAIDPDPTTPIDARNYDPFNSLNQQNFDFEWYAPGYAQDDLIFGDGTTVSWRTGGTLPAAYGAINYFDNNGIVPGIDLATPDSEDRYTTYYRIPFSVSGGGPGPWVLEYLADDGAAFYLDGEPLVQVNCCNDDGTEITDGTEPWYTTTAFNATGTEDNLRTILLPGLNLSNGDHLLSISLHQANTTSSDAGLDFRIFKPGSGRPWGVDASGDWADPANWSIDPADTSSEYADFGDIYQSPHTIWTNEPVTVDGVQFESDFTYNIAGTGSVNLNDGGLHSLLGNHSFQVNVNLNSNINAEILADSSIDFNNRLNLNARTLTKSGAGDIIIGNTANTGTGMLVVDEGGVAGSGVLAGDLQVNGGVVAPGGLVVPVGASTTFTINGDATVNGGITLNIFGNGDGDAVSGGGTGILAVGGATLDIIVDAAYQPANGDAVQIFPGWSSINGGVNAPAGWSFDATSGTLTFGGGGGLACDLDSDSDCDVADIDALTNRAGVTRQEIDDWLAAAGPANGFSDAFRPGDANLDGVVDAQDLNAVGQNWQGQGTMWSTGDFTGDDATDAQDLNAVGQNWQSVVPAAAAAAAVPEPASLGMVWIAVLGLWGLRRRE